jgi:hypothetical protein
VAAGAPRFPDKAIGRAYVMDQIAQDLKRIPDADRPSVRYFSLNHLRGEKSEEEIDEYRTSLGLAVASLTRKPANRVSPLAIEPTGTVFRIDLRHYGWDQKAYDPGSLNLWDLVLLEYPYGVVETAQPRFQEVAEELLLPAKQIRPVAYVHGDWFVWLASKPDFTQDFLHVPFGNARDNPVVDPQVAKLAKRFADGRITLPLAAAEVGVGPSLSNVSGLLDLPTDRQTWESQYPHVIRALRLGVPIEAIDATIRPTITPAATDGLELKTNHRDNIFKPGNRAKIIAHNGTNQDIFAEVVAFSTWIVEICKPQRIKPGMNVESEEFTIDDVKRKDEVILFASSNQFPGYYVVGGGEDKEVRPKGGHITSRIVHPLYKLERIDGTIQVTANPGPIIRKRIVVETQ